MADKKVVKPVALAVGAALASSFALTGVAMADSIDSPFEMSSLKSGYMLGVGEGGCGGEETCHGAQSEERGVDVGSHRGTGSCSWICCECDTVVASTTDWTRRPAGRIQGWTVAVSSGRHRPMPARAT